MRYRPVPRARGGAEQGDSGADVVSRGSRGRRGYERSPCWVARGGSEGSGWYLRSSVKGSFEGDKPGVWGRETG